MNIYTAIPLPEEIKDKFVDLAHGKLPFPYVNTINLHITLNFLGDLDTDSQAFVAKLWAEGLPKLKKIKIEFDQVVKFRTQLHLTLKPNPELEQLVKKLWDILKPLGYKSNYPNFYPHVTIGNLHMDKVMFRERKIADFPNEALNKLSFVADRIVMFQSKLLLHHPQHIELAEHKLV